MSDRARGDAPSDGDPSSRDIKPGFAKPDMGGGYGRDFGGGGRNQGFDGSWGQGYGGSTGASDYRNADGGDAYGGGVTGADYEQSFGGRGDDMGGDNTWLRGERRDARDDADGPFGGRGPQGWRRTDARLREQVCEALSEDAALDASGLEVEAADGVVILRGDVPSDTDRRHAEQLARRTPGVREVKAELEVRGH